ncbi:MAG: FMN-binding protein [Myxococcota bacterium]
MTQVQHNQKLPAELPVLQAGASPPKLAASPEPSSVRLILTLGTTGFLSGLCLVLVFLATAPAIERNRIAAIERAVFEVLPGAESFEILEADQEGGVALLEEGEKASGPVVYAGKDDRGRLVGYAVPGSGPGFQDTLEILVGWDHARERVVGMAVLESRETPGLGDKIISDTDFTSSFLDLSVEPAAVVVAPGSREGDNEVDGISGATISASAVVRIVNETISAWKDRLPDEDTLSAARSEADGETGSAATGGEAEGRSSR